MRVHVQYPREFRLLTSEDREVRMFSLDGRRFFKVLVTDRGVRVDSEATMGRRRYYYGDELTLRFGRKQRPLVTAKGHPSRPIGFEEKSFEIS